MGLDYIRTYNQKQQAIYAAKTGFFVDIQNIGNNSELIAVKERRSRREIKPGVWLQKQATKFKDGNFTNIYDFSWDPKSTTILPEIHSSNTPYSLFDQVTNDPSIVGAINGSFFFLADVTDTIPHELAYDFCIRDGNIFGLPTSDRPIMYIRNNKMYVAQPKAKGIITIGNQTITWVGAKSGIRNKNRYDAWLYNSKSSTIIMQRDKETNVQIGIVDTENITTPVSKTVYDISICSDETGTLRITNVQKGGGTHFYNGIMVFQFKGIKPKFHLGQKVTPLSLDSIALKTISSGLTIGKRVTSPFFSEPERIMNRDARSIIAKDNTGNIHFMVFDGSKYIPGFRGVSQQDIVSFFSPDKYAWAYFLDGGGSSRIIVKEEAKLHVLANQFAFKKMHGGHHLWDWQSARQLASSISLRLLEN